jgi:hypothetical protein
MLHLEARNFEMAVEHFNVVMEHVTHDEKLRMARANALLALGRRGDAINDVAYVAVCACACLVHFPQPYHTRRRKSRCTA